MNHLAYVLANDKEVLRYLKTRFPVYHLSNVFFRDIHYGIIEYLRDRRMSVRYSDAEKIARAFIEKLDHEKILRQLDHQTWMVQYADFRTPKAKVGAPVPAAPAKTSTSADAAKSLAPAAVATATAVAANVPGTAPAAQG